MDNFIFSINATLPIFLTMVLGLVFRKIGVFDDAFTNRMNSFVFKFALPALLFEDLWEENFYQAWDGGFVLFLFLCHSWLHNCFYCFVILFER